MFLMDLAAFVWLTAHDGIEYKGTHHVQSEYNEQVNYAYDYYQVGEFTCILNENKRGMCGKHDVDFGA